MQDVKNRMLFTINSLEFVKLLCRKLSSNNKKWTLRSSITSMGDNKISISVPQDVIRYVVLLEHAQAYYKESNTKRVWEFKEKTQQEVKLQVKAMLKSVNSFK